MEGYLYCGLALNLETMEVRRSRSTKWWVRDGIDKAPRDVIRRCVADAMLMWSRHANVSAIEASSEQDADFLVITSSIDGRQGVLADCQLPGPRQQLCRIDNAEAWTVQLGPSVANNVIDLDRVMKHEIGHFWGIGHDRQGAKSLMAPTYSRSIFDAKEWDIEMIQSLYGPPMSIPEPGQIPTYQVWYDQNGKEMKRFRLTEIGSDG